jgi:hypothetical protein
MDMQKTINILIVVALIFGGAYFTMKSKKSMQGDSVNSGQETFSQADIGLEFEYPGGEEGYVIDERIPVDLGTGLVKVLILFRAEDLKNAPPEGGEGPAVITVAVFENKKKQSSRVWAEENELFSNLNVKLGEVTEAVVGGANAIRYMVDGLYSSQVALVAHGENVYIINGEFIDQNSDIYRDFEAILKSIRFIPKSGQE